MAQGQGNLAVRLVPSDAQATLPAFEAGSHVDVHLPTGLVRQYSIASAPHETAFYTLCVRHESASRGGSRYIHERLRVGDTLRIGTPRNLFALQPAPHSVLMAGGIGITPLLAMAHTLERHAQSFELHYYARERRQVAFARQWLKGFVHGTVQVHCSEEGQSIRTQLPARLHAVDTTTHLYICGPHGFMQHITAQATALGWPSAQLHQEAFAPPASAQAAPTTSAQTDAAFEVELASTGSIFVIPVGQSIAAVLQDQGVEVSLSCEMGICGACLTPVHAGKPDHRDTVQTEAEKCGTSQHVALCCSRSHSPRLVLGL
ncbi:oxidoreductase [Lampropedia puyangensis]|uniref:Oxidoreductase n=2 Tax=Lampropedia puyangensis TaxID=1330072 RepID=A0A4S8EXP1_9BURK|nr:oxidoreductase [Lampropedia puyangensis]